jgi:hypothetical protein
VSYLFFCSDATERECLRNGLFGNNSRFWDEVKRIKVGDPVFLYNLNTGSLMGPFKASSEPMIHKDPYAFMGSGTYPAQVEVTWTKLHIIRNASKTLPFLRNRLKCKLTPKETVQLFQALHEAQFLQLSGWL